MNCKICNTKNELIFKSKIMNKYDISYFYCKNCNFLSTEDPYWLNESYESSINSTDTGILKRNNFLSNITATIIFFLFDKKASFLDFAGGYGISTRLMRDIGFDFLWTDKYSDNLVARGFEYDGEANIELITSFESFEHFVDPIDEIENMFKISNNILFTTSLLPTNKIPNPNEWWYYGLEHGQHISFYSYKTLEYLATKYNKNIYTNGRNIHLFTNRNFSSLAMKLITVYYLIKLPNIVNIFNKSKTITDMNSLVSNIQDKV